MPMLHPEITQPTSDPLAKAIEACVERLTVLKSQVKQVEDVLAKLREMSVGGEVPNIPSVRPDEYKNVRLGHALANYLRGRRGMKIPFARIVEDLRIGGVYVGEKNTLEHNIKIAARQRKHVIACDPETWAMWIAPTADEPKQKKKK